MKTLSLLLAFIASAFLLGACTPTTDEQEDTNVDVTIEETMDDEEMMDDADMDMDMDDEEMDMDDEEMMDDADMDDESSMDGEVEAEITTEV